jgi:hypothetical protein
MVAIEASASEQVGLVCSDGIHKFGGGAGDAGVHGVAGESGLQVGRRIVGAQIDETHFNEDESERKNENQRDDAENESFHGALLLWVEARRA